MKQFKSIIFGMFILLSTGLNANTINMAPIISYLLSETSNSSQALTFVNNTSFQISDCYSNDCPGVVESEINVVGAERLIKKITITLDISHGVLADLKITLISPSGISSVLSDPDPDYAFFDWSWNYCDTIFDDDAKISIMDATAITETGHPSYGCIIGTYSPEEQLSIFEGEYSDGIWTLLVEDWVWIDEGDLNSWSITIE